MAFLKSEAALDEIAAIELANFYDVEMLIVYWETKPEIVARLLPPPLQPVSRPLVMAFVANYPRTNFGPGYYEGALFLRSQYQGRPGNYCLGMPVTGDMAMAIGREKYGFPKKLAEISLERDGHTVSAVMNRCGARFFEAHARLDRAPNARDFPALLAQATAPDAERALSYNVKYLLAANGRGFSGFDYNPYLVSSLTVLKPQMMKIGAARVQMEPSDSDPWSEIEVTRMAGAVYMEGSTSLYPGAILSQMDAETFAPYAYLRWDW